MDRVTIQFIDEIHSKRIELINWVLENMKNSEINICAVIECKMNEIVDQINKKQSIMEQDPLDSELRILDWIFYQVCSSEIKNYNPVLRRTVWPGSQMNVPIVVMRENFTCWMININMIIV